MATEDGTPQGTPTDPPQGDTKDSAPQGDTKPPQGGTPTAPPADTTDWKAEAKKWEQRAKKDAQQMDALRTALLGEKSDAEKRAEVAELTALRYRVAYEANLPPDLADRLLGDTEEEIRADAAKLSGYAKAAARPKSDARADDKGQGTKQDPNDLLRRLAGLR